MEEVKFKKLEILKLCWNKISNINIFENANFKELKELDLSNNEINDIRVLEKVKFKKIEKLKIERNKISNEFLSTIRDLKIKFNASINY